MYFIQRFFKCFFDCWLPHLLRQHIQVNAISLSLAHNPIPVPKDCAVIVNRLNGVCGHYDFS
jgi:hypothetical protein